MALAAALASYQLAHELKGQDELSFRPPSPLPLPDLDLTESPPSSLSSSPKAPSLAISTSSSTCSERPNEHLAVLLPKHLWKPDSVARSCDSFYCRAPFSLLERRHHCRKCGGVFCASCTRQRTPLLDCSRLAFLHPPRNVPVSDFESPESPVLNSRVCDDCHDQIWGRRPSTPRTDDASLAPPHTVPRRPGLTRGFSNPSIGSFRRDDSLAPTFTHSPTEDAPPSPLDALPVIDGPGLTRKSRSLRDPKHRRSSIQSEPGFTSTPSSPRIARNLSPESESGQRRLSVRTSLGSPIISLPDPSKEPSYGALDAYPLRRRSLVCKATGGGRWEPRNEPELVSARAVPGGKALYELEMEEEERMEQERLGGGKVVVDGEFRYRFVCSQPASVSP